MRKYQLIPCILCVLFAPVVNALQVLIKHDKTFVINVELTDSLATLRNTIKTHLGISDDNFLLVANAEILKGDKVLRDFPIYENTTIFLTFTPILDGRKAQY